MDIELKKKYESLKSGLKRLESAVFSIFRRCGQHFPGLKLPMIELGENVLAVTATSVLFPACDCTNRANAQEMAEKIGIRHRILELKVMAVPQLHKNTPDRCYYCKNDFFWKINHSC